MVIRHDSNVIWSFDTLSDDGKRVEMRYVIAKRGTSPEAALRELHGGTYHVSAYMSLEEYVRQGLLDSFGLLRLDGKSISITGEVY